MYRIFKILFIITGSLVFADRGLISGKVMGDSMPLAGANVYLSGTSMGATSDSIGNYIINDIPSGKYSLRADYIGYESSAIEIYVSASDVGSGDSGESSFSAKLGLEEDEDETADMVKGNQLVGIDFNLFASAVGLNEIVVSAAKKKQKITKAPATISTVNNMSIRQQTGLNNYAKLVTGLKGVDVSYYGIQGAQINARGFSGMFSTRFKQYKNGLDMAELFSSQIYPQISSPPKETIEKIEVVFGPQSSLYGADASTGLLNIIPKDPRYNQDSEANISYSSYGNKSRYRFGARFAQKISENWAWDIGTEISQAEELDYGNTVKKMGNNDSARYVDPVSWYVPNADGTTDSLHLKDDYYGAMDQAKFQLVNNILHTFSSGNLLRISPGYIRANGYTMGSVGPYYTKLYEDLTFEVQYTTDMHSLRYYYVNQGTIAVAREPLAKYQATNDYTFEEALEKAGNLGTVEDREMWTNSYDGYSHLVDYQLNYDMQLKNRQLEFVGGFDYDFIDPNSNRQMYDDNGYDYFLDTLVTDKADIKESRYGTYIQLGTDLSNSLSITGSARYDWHEAYGGFVSPKLGIVKENFLNGSLKFMVGRGFKAPFLNDRYIYTGAKTYKGGEGFPYSLDLIAIGNKDGFTLNNFMDANGNGAYDGEGVDSLLYSNKIDPLKLEITNTIEMSYSGLVRKNLIFELGAYVSQYDNFKTALKHFGTTGPGAFSWTDKTGPFVSLDPGSYIEILQGDNRLQANTIAVTYQSLPVKTNVWGFETGFKYYSEKLTFDVNYTHFNDNDLVTKREKGKRYNNAFIYTLTGDSSFAEFEKDTSLIKFESFRKIYSNTPNHQMNLTATLNDVIKKGLSIRLQLRGTTEFEFASGWFEATKEGDPDIQEPYKDTQSFYKNKGPVGGGIYTAVNIGYAINENLSIGLAINNLFESNAVSFPLTPVIPRTFVLETGYRF